MKKSSRLDADVRSEWNNRSVGHGKQCALVELMDDNYVLGMELHLEFEGQRKKGRSKKTYNNPAEEV